MSKLGTSETNSGDRVDGENVCAGCDCEYSLRDGQEPSEFCDSCAHDEVLRLQAVVADQALTIGTLKDEAARLNTENDDWHNASRELRDRIERQKHLLDEERKLTAATVTGGELHWLRRAWVEAGDCLRADNAPDAESACLDLQRWVAANPRPVAP